MKPLAVTVACLPLACLLAVPALARSERVALPNGRVVTLAYPGEDGVTRPRALSVAGEVALPLSASGLNQDASVLLAVLVRRNGSVAVADAIDSSHPGLGLEAAAERAAGSWTFRPARRGRERVDSFTFVNVTFRRPERSQGAPTLALAGLRTVGTTGIGAAKGSTSVGAGAGSRLSKPVIPRGPAGTIYDRSSIWPGGGINLTPMPQVVVRAPVSRR